jgi:acyl-CoA synthetase
LACSREGFACNPSLHRTHTCKDIVELLKRLDAKALITEVGWGADREATDFAATLAEVDSLRKVYTPENLPQPGDEPTTAATDNPDLVSYLAFTSGTTGTPKCMRTHTC